MRLKGVVALTATAVILLTVSACSPEDENGTPPGIGPSWEVHALLDKSVVFGRYSAQFPTWDSGDSVGTTYVSKREAGDNDTAAAAILAMKDIPGSSDNNDLHAEEDTLPDLLYEKLDAAMYWAYELRSTGGTYTTDDAELDGLDAHSFSGQFTFASGEGRVIYGGMGYCIHTDGADYLVMVLDMSQNQGQGAALTQTIKDMAASFCAQLPAKETEAFSMKTKDAQFMMTLD